MAESERGVPRPKKRWSPAAPVACRLSLTYPRTAGATRAFRLGAPHLLPDLFGAPEYRDQNLMEAADMCARQLATLDKTAKTSAEPALPRWPSVLKHTAERDARLTRALTTSGAFASVGKAKFCVHPS